MKKYFLKNFAIGAFILFIIIFFYRPLETEDIWWHLNVGRWILDQRALPHVDIFPFTSRADPWILTQWLGSVIFYLVQKAAGYAGLQGLRSAIFVSALGVFFHYARRKIPFAWLLLLMFVMAFGLGTRCLLRPFIFNLICVQIFLIILLCYQDHGNHRKLYWLPALMILWGNLHVGSFIYGLGLIGVFLFSEIIRYTAIKPSQPAAIKKIKELSFILALSMGALCINPYGLTGALFPIKALLVPGFIDFYGMGHMTSEMQPPTEIFSMQGAWFFLLLIPSGWMLSIDRKENFTEAKSTGLPVDLAAVLARGFMPRASGDPKGRPLTQLILFLIALLGFLYARRGADFFVIIAAYVIAQGAQRLSWGKRWHNWPGHAVGERFIYVFIIFLSVCNVIHAANQKVFVNNQLVRKIFLQEEPDSPRAAVRFLLQQGIAGRVFNSYEYGGYIGWLSYPRLKPFVDGRQANQCDSKIYLRILADPDKFWPAAERQYQFDIVLFNANEAFHYKFMDYLAARAEWQLVFVEGPVVVFVKRGKFVLSQTAADFEENLKTTKISLEKIPPPILEKKSTWEANIKNFFNPSVEYNAQWETGAILYTLGYKDAGIKMVSESVKVSGEKKAIRVLSLMLRDYQK